MGTFLDVGLTGGICCGKSTTLRMFATLDCFTLDADSIYHRLIRNGQPLYNRIFDWLGEKILDGRREIDRVILGEIVFNDKKALEKLNSIAHPMVVAEQDRLKEEIRSGNDGGIIITDAALMIEAGTYKRYDKVVVVICNIENQIRRLKLRARLDDDEARKRISAQMPATEKAGYADYTIHNDESLEGLKRKIEDVYDQLVLDLRAKEKQSV